MTGRGTLALAGMAAVVFTCWVRPRLLRWGATDDEVAGLYPGAAILDLVD